MDCDSFVLSIKTENIIKDLKNLEDSFDFSNLDVNHELFSNKNRKDIGKFKIETSKVFWIDEFIACEKNVMLSYVETKVKIIESYI